MLSKEFLDRFRKAGDRFPNLLARSTYLGKYCRDGETWTDTIARVVEGNVKLDKWVSRIEAEKLFELFWSGAALPPGRGLWTGGIDIPVDARYNCAYVTIASIDDWAYCSHLLMCGCGVGVGLQRISELPTVTTGHARLTVLCSHSHPNRDEVMPDEVIPENSRQVVVDDSREGWVTALKEVLAAAYNDESLTVNVSSIRKRGARIKTFGGIACGPAPLSNMLRSVWAIVRGAQGRKLNSVECLDITNYIGICIKSGNVRRSALIVLGQADDQAFRDAKKDWNAVTSHRHSSNNSIIFETQEQIDGFDWRSLVEDNSEYGEPGFLNLHKIRQTDPLVEGINPCFAADTLIHTRHGHFQIKDLVGKTVDVWDGTSWRTVDTFQVTSKNESMLRITLQDGSSFRVTKYHAIVLEDGSRVEAKDLEVGEKLLISNAESTHGEVYEPGAYLKGFLVGDGTSHDGRPLLWLYPPKFCSQDRLIQSALEIGPRKVFTTGVSEPGFVPAGDARMSMRGLTARDTDIIDWCDKYKRHLPKEIFAWNLVSKLEFIAGVMDADGTASDTANGWLYQISSIHKQWLLDFQNLLKTVGVNSKLALARAGGKKDFNDGYGEYETNDCWRLTISQAASIVLASQVKFERLVSFADKITAYRVKPRWNKVVEIQDDGIDEEVYCLVTDDPDKIACTNGLIIGRCGEIPLENRGFCCLSEVYPALTKDTNEALRLTTRYTLRQRLEPVSDPTADYVRQQSLRLGVGLGGLCDFEWTEDDLAGMYQVVRNEANEYARELGVNTPIKVSTVKPSGTISLLNGSSPGVHAPFAPYYIRRTRIGKDEPMAQALAEAGVPSEKCVYDSTGNTLVFSFPMRAALGADGQTVQTESARDQVERMVKVQRSWADNAVSCTVSFSEDEKEELAQLLKENISEIKSISCLPKKHAYEQPPYEAISAEDYLQRHVAINHQHPLTVGGDLDTMECENGVCPIK